ncbi:hypothetical protein [Hymenobacter persicinus]|uniref:hypothetical protein n=1 Tax=Hymenobacter persicinus TaxID=2025506 RepID=UPI0013EDB2E1|nr:hypothetical protein [Hymenobacter persicinus]
MPAPTPEVPAADKPAIGFQYAANPGVAATAAELQNPPPAPTAPDPAAEPGQ